MLATFGIGAQISDSSPNTTDIGFISDYYEKSDAERHLVFKLDCFMLSVMTLGWWLKNLDQSNVSLLPRFRNKSPELTTNHS